MCSLSALEARGLLLLILVALGANGQLLTEKIPLGKVFVLYGDLRENAEIRIREKILHLRNEVLSLPTIRSTRKQTISISFHNKTSKGFALWHFLLLFHLILLCLLLRVPFKYFVGDRVGDIFPERKKGRETEREEKQTEIM